MINFNENQNHNLPADAQACGGYSLAAVLTSLNMPRPAAPRVGHQVYNIIQAIQQRGGAVDPVLQGVINQNQCLPSYICQYARTLGLNVEVAYDNALLGGLLGGAAILEEVNFILGMGIAVHAVPAPLALMQQGNYYIVLVNNATHWVVVQQDAAGFHMYDPAAGNVQTTPAFNLHGNIFSGMYIKIN